MVKEDSITVIYKPSSSIVDGSRKLPSTDMSEVAGWQIESRGLKIENYMHPARFWPFAH